MRWQQRFEERAMNEALANADNPKGADIGKDARRPARLDRRTVGTVHGVGTITEGLRPGPEARKKRGEREESDYVMQTPLKVLKVLEALEGRAFEPATINRVAQRTGFSQNFVRNALLTLKEAGYAKRTYEGFIVGPKLARFASRITASNSVMAE